ncbi:hypothetical protein BVRB_8g184440 [Beta vulgaris subsp. vulgaris]|nr:hypothetical protein BVRB_8g184440 [Beta vulgaris subsp. vulgaris]
MFFVSQSLTICCSSSNQFNMADFDFKEQIELSSEAEEEIQQCLFELCTCGCIVS